MVQEMLLEGVDEGTADDAAEDVVGGAAGVAAAEDVGGVGEMQLLLRCRK